MAWDADSRRLWAIEYAHPDTHEVEDSTNWLIEIDPDTGAGTFVGDCEMTALHNMAVDPSTGILWSLHDVGYPRYDDSLVQINTITGMASEEPWHLIEDGVVGMVIIQREGEEPPPDPCPYEDATITSPADLALYEPCVELNTVYLHITSGVEDVTLPNLETVHDYIYFHMNEDVRTVSFPALSEVGGYVYFHDNDTIESIDLGVLETVGRYFYLNDNDTVTTLSGIDGLSYVGEYVHIVSNDDLCVPDLDWESFTVEDVDIYGNGWCEVDTSSFGPGPGEAESVSW